MGTCNGRFAWCEVKPRNGSSIRGALASWDFPLAASWQRLRRPNTTDGAPDAADPVDRQGSRPGFQALLYPAIPRDLNFSRRTPPAFLVCGADDQVSQGLAELYLALKRAGGHAELHIYEGVGHGFGLRASNAGPVAGWPQRFLEWLGRSDALMTGE